MTESQYLTALSAFPYFGPARVRLLVSYFKSAKNVWLADLKKLSNVGLPANKIGEFENFRRGFDIPSYFKRLEALGIRVVVEKDKLYPTNLRDLDDAPIAIYVKGKLRPEDVNAIAIVGSRLMTTYGREAANKISSGLANLGITIISGLALGVDAAAQKAALAVGGRTIAVLASGLDIISPVSNRALAMEFIKKNGALISEYPLGHVPFRSDFAFRNRLISGLSKGVVVIEGRMKSGTFYTVNAAAVQGRPVFAVPGPITSPSSEAPNYLIQNGAKLTTGVKDILDELHLQVKVDRRAMEQIIPQDSSELAILKILEVEPLHLDEIVRISGVTTGKVSARLTIMEMKGLVGSLGGGMYKKL